ncbi:MAG: carbon starvation CstA family protein [Prevotella sp.]|nr:carbon starvation CstA family protein [Prevotellaceae bacterium]MDD7075459.1 carbon starvation CstA family protein [Prevotellaceae bacterium]MDY5210802.1 carbon starvation CstA family protein [Prevotella sp.]MDY5343623.1 carbon starvation CstA family protein [Prevotella sp.]
MITFILSLLALVLGYFVYGRFVERVFGPDDRETPAIAKADGVDFMVLPNWKIFMIQFLNIAGTGPIFGAIMGAKFGPSAYLWIVFGCIFAGATHDYLSGMISMRKGGVGLPEVIGDVLGERTRKLMLVFSVVLLTMVGAVFVYSPAEILDGMAGTTTMWIIIIFAYYFIATMLPVDKVIGRIYPIFAFSLLFMAGALMVVLFLKWPSVPELWDGLGNKALTVDSSWSSQLYPCLFITIACGAISGFHATQSPLMGRCMKSERMGRPIFYGAMITEGVVALIWATVASYFFYAEPQPGYQVITELANNGFSTSAPKVVNIICNDWLGVAGGILAMLGVVAAPITSGDTALRSARLIIADFIRIEQRTIKRRLLISVPLFLCCIALLLWQVENPDGFNVIWQYFGWSNQTLSVFTLWAITVYLLQNGKPYYFMLIPALFMTTICATYLFVSKQAFGMPDTIGYILGVVVLIVAYGWFHIYESKYKKNNKIS